MGPVDHLHLTRPKIRSRCDGLCEVWCIPHRFCGFRRWAEEPSIDVTVDSCHVGCSPLGNDPSAALSDLAAPPAVGRSVRCSGPEHCQPRISRMRIRAHCQAIVRSLDPGSGARVARAVPLLREPGLTVATVAESAGFSSARSLSEATQLLLHTTPRRLANWTDQRILASLADRVIRV